MLILVRHGESSANAKGLLLGRTDADLTPRGRREAAAISRLLARWPRPVREVRTSPLRRAAETASAVAEATGAHLVTDSRWIEVDYGQYEGTPLGSVPSEVWQRWRADPEFRPAGGETLAEVADRVALACTELFASEGAGARAEGGDMVIVSHVSPIKAAVTWALFASPAMAWQLHLSTGSFTQIGWGAGVPVLHGFNASPPVPETA